jgi:hypothetical protein
MGFNAFVHLMNQVNDKGDVIYDTHVAVKEQVTDYRTFVSGIHWYDIKDAPSFESVRQKVAAILKVRAKATIWPQGVSRTFIHVLL